MNTNIISLRGRHILPAGRFARILISLTLGCAVFSGVMQAQTSGDEAWYRRFANNMGKVMFAAAWPSDTFDRMEFGGVDFRDGGADVSVVLYGTSWLEGKVWTEVVVEVRNGDVSNLRWGKFQAAWPPGTFWRGVKDSLDAMNREYQREHPQRQVAPPAPSPLFTPNRLVSGNTFLCVSNPTPASLFFSVPADNITRQEIAANKTLIINHPGTGAFTISFAGTMGGDRRRTVSIAGNPPPSEPNTCDAKMTWDFIMDGNEVGLMPRQWAPGTPHPFIENVVRAADEGKWVCASGFKWLVPAEFSDCIPVSQGILGITFEVLAGDSYPTVTEVRSAGPADRAGIVPHSRILRINGESLSGLSVDQMTRRMRGPVGSIAHLVLDIPGRGSGIQVDVRRE